MMCRLLVRRSCECSATAICGKNSLAAGCGAALTFTRRSWRTKLSRLTRSPSERRSADFSFVSVLYNLRVNWRAKSGLAAVLLALLAPLRLPAQAISQLPPPNDYVSDFAHVLEARTIAQIDDICGQIEEKAHTQIALVTVNSLEGTDIESYA